MSSLITGSLFCESCNKEKGLDRGTRFTCEDCESRILARTAKPINLLDRNIPELPEEYLLSRKELMELRLDKLLTLKLYIYFAFRMDYSKNPVKDKVNLKNFCKRWQVTQEDVLVSVAALARKGFMKLEISELKAQALSHDERIEMLENLLNDNASS